MKVVLNVAEKPSVAKEIVKHLSKNNSTKTFNASKYNPIYEFPYLLKNEEVRMRVTSVSGHIMNLEFMKPYNSWNMVSPDELFTAPIQKIVTQDKHDVVATLKFASRGINMLALWLDCDREGENIAYEVIHLVLQASPLPNSAIYRAHFSALTATDIVNAAQNLRFPKVELADAVDARQEIDLRLGAAFTRLQTMRLRNENQMLMNSLISWGPCQFPTLGFVVNRYLEITNFVSEEYWTIDLSIQKSKEKVAKFTWKRDKLFDFQVTLALYEKCLSESECTITHMSKNPKTKYKPVPLSTIEFEKLAASKLRIGSEKAMAIAEKLYQQGIISYPRTETDMFKSTINLRELIEIHKHNPSWGGYVEGMIQGNFSPPRKGGHDDNSHPPIHPVKSVTTAELTGDEFKVYELITRRFLACCSQDAKGFETRVEATIGGELFECKGIEVIEENFLKIYVYMKWNEAQLPMFQEGEKFVPSSLLMNQHKTQPPSLLSESDLIGVMDKAGIGTDATIHQHIKTIQDRKYVEKTPAGLFKPTSLGLALVKGYAEIGTSLHQPELRAKMERELNGIVNKTSDKEQVIRSIMLEMTDVFAKVKREFQVIVQGVRQMEAPEVTEARSGFICYKCGMQGHHADQCEKAQSESEIRILSSDQGERVIVCYKCKKPGHLATHCEAAQVPANEVKKVIKCFKCGQEGHYANNCNSSAEGRKPGDHSGGDSYQARPKEKKVCSKCGHVGRHPKGSECLKKSKK